MSGIELGKPFDQMVVEACAVEQPSDHVAACEDLHLFGEARAGLGRGDRIAQHLEHVERDGDHRRDEQQAGDRKNLVGPACLEEEHPDRRNHRQQQLADRDRRPAGIARRDAYAVAEGGDDGQELGDERRIELDGDGREQADHHRIAEGADFEDQFERERLRRSSSRGRT
ncbi:MAG: hypothetical protein QM762_04805 [Chryseolinea sp.]